MEAERPAWYPLFLSMAKDTQRNIVPTRRVKDILRLLDRTPLPADLILQASETFGTLDDRDDGFSNVRRVREKMQQLAARKLVSVEEYTLVHRGAVNFYQLAPDGYRMLLGRDPPPSHRKFFRPVAKLNWEHTYANAKVIVKTLVSAYRAGIRISSFCRERELILEAGGHRVEPDHFFQFQTSGRVFNQLVEVDRNTETLDSLNPRAWRQRILGYDAYQDRLLAGRRKEPQRRLRVTFLTTTIEHAYNFLALVGHLLGNRRRVLFYAATIDAYLNDRDPLRNPIFLDHRGRFQALVNIHPGSLFIRDPVQLPRHVVELPQPI